MALPLDMAVVTVTIGPEIDFAGNFIGAATVTFQPSANIIWEADGTPLFARPLEVKLDDTGSGQIILPATDQDGFIDDQGHSITNWTYAVTWKFTDQGIKKIATKNILLPQAVETVDLDLTIPVNGSAGITVDLPAVLSVNGQTGNVVVSGGGGGSGDFSGAAADVSYVNTTSHLVSDDLQSAIDELKAYIDTILPPSGTTDGYVATVNSGSIEWDAPTGGGGGGGGSGDADDISFTPGSSGLSSTNVQDAIVELAASWASEETSWLAEARDGVVLESVLGVANGVATLDSDGLLTSDQLPGGGGGGGGSAYATVYNDGGALTQRTKLKFTGDGVSVADDSGSSTTIVTIEGGGSGSGGGGGSAEDYEPEGADPLIWDHGDGVDGGEETIPTYALASLYTMVSGTAVFTYFTAKSDHTGCTKLWFANSTAGPTLTTGKMGIYSVDGSGNLTLMASCSNDTGMLTTANSVQVETISSVNLVRGTRYAIGILAVGSGTFPKLYCTSTTPALNGAFITGAPVKASNKTGQSDLAASYSNTDVSSVGPHLYAGVK